MLFKIIGLLAAILTTSSFIPQAIKTIKTKDTSGISLEMYIMFTSGVFLWACYGVYIRDTAVLVSNIVTFIFAFIVLKYKIDSKRSKKED